MDDGKIKVLFEDGIEITYDNLDELALGPHMPKAKLRHMIATKRKIPGILCITIISPQGETIANSNEIIQCDELGNEIRRFRNANEARIETGINNIYKVLDGTANTAGGYIWKYADYSVIANCDDKTKIVLVSNTCEVIGEYRNAKEAANDTCIDESAIENSARHFIRTDAGFFIMLNGTSKEIIEIDNDGFINCIYEKLSEACEETGLSKNKICNSYSRNSYINGYRYMRLETILKNYEPEVIS